LFHNAIGQTTIDSFSLPQYYIREEVRMKILVSRSSYKLSVILEDIEALLYQEALRTQRPVAIPELEGKRFIIKEINRDKGEGAPGNIWHLVIEQADPEVKR
jgi:hypothetical protein